MSTTNVNNEGAKDKIKELAESIDMCMMGTNFTDPPLHVIPMSTKKVDDQGNIWFLSNKNSNHNAHIKKDPRTQLIYANPKGMEFMTLFGKAQITMERSILKDLYGKSDDAWFNGVDDPNLTAIQIAPSEGHYWDTKHGSLVALFEMGMAAITGEQTDLIEEGDIVP